MFNLKWLGVGCGWLITIFFVWLAIAPPNFLQTVLQRLDNLTYDLRLNLLLPKHPQLAYPIVIVDVDEKSLQAEGHWPWSRNKLAALVQHLYTQGATVIAFDMLFPEAEENIADKVIQHLQIKQASSSETIQTLQQVKNEFDHDALFAKTLAISKDSIVLGIFFSSVPQQNSGLLPVAAIDLSKINATQLALPQAQSYLANVPTLQQAAKHAGSLSIFPDEDGMIRRYALLQRYNDKLYPSLALEAVRLYLLSPSINIETLKVGNQLLLNTIYLGQTAITTDKEGRVFIPYLGPAQTFPYYSATDVLHDRLPVKQLKNALVFIGTSAVGLGDLRSTPVGGVYPGVEVHANVAQALFSNHFNYVPDWAPGAQVVLLLFIGFLLAWIFIYIGPIWISIITFIVLAGLFWGSMVLWRSANLVLPVILPSLQIITLAVFTMAYGFLTETRKRYELKRVFEQYVPSGRVEEIAKNPNNIASFEGERKVLTVLFMDIRNFTAISEKLPIGELKKLLNFFLTEMTSVIFKHGGTIDKYVGDMVMAFWGAPLPDAAHAKHAISAGLDMIATTERLQDKLAAMHLPSVRIGIGINTGTMDVGDMGSTFRRAYTVLGDAVNLASRLESLTKYYGVDMIVGENTFLGQNEFVFRLIDKVRVKGKNDSITIYQPLGLRALMSAEKLVELALYDRAITAYFQQDWPSAILLFKELQEKSPNVILYQIYLARIGKFSTQPSIENWDGVWTHVEK